MSSRRSFVRRSLAGIASLSAAPWLKASNPQRSSYPLVVSTWNNKAANQAAIEALQQGGRALDAVEQGVRVVEADPKDRSVGFGGRPDRDGNVTLDASIMDEYGNCGSVCFLQNIMHPVSVARKVMEETPHVMLAGQGAEAFALAQGFESQDLLTNASKRDWKAWKKNANYEPIINIENHDTIGMLAIDTFGNLSGACTTSGLAYKFSGRVGDSPIIGAGLYVDNEVGAAVATGLGEAVVKTCGSFLVVELMRQGWSPTAACREAIKRIVSKQPDHKKFQVGFLALNTAGQVGAYSLQSGFIYTRHHQDKSDIQPSKYFL